MLARDGNRCIIGFMTHQITLEEKASAEDRAIIGKGIARFGNGLFPGTSITDVTFFVRDEAGAIVGGVAGNYGSFGWLYVDALWVSEELRGHGYGNGDDRGRGRPSRQHKCVFEYFQIPGTGIL